MKKVTVALLTGAVFCYTQSSAQKVEFKEHVSQELGLSNKASASVLTIYNLNGTIRVEGYSGDKVQLEIDKTLSAKEPQSLEKGKNEFKLEIQQRGDSIISYIAAPFDSRPNNDAKKWYEKRQLEYQYKLDFVVKVPMAMNLHVSTVNGGEVSVKDVMGRLGIYNVNGGISIVNANGTALVRTINGNVKANFLNVPPDSSSFKTINGSIHLVYPASLSADCEFKSFNGEFFTDFQEAKALPATVSRSQSKEHDKTVYKLHSTRAIRIGSGGTGKLNLETFNGNIYLKKQS